MQLEVAVDIRVPSLFMHDKYDCSPVDENWLADKLTASLSGTLVSTYSRVVVESPDRCGLRRFVLTVEAWNGEVTRYSDRYYSMACLRRHWPSDVFAAVKALDGYEIRVRV